MQAARTSTMAHNDRPAQRGGSNLRTALILLSIAAVFFIGVIVNRWLLGG